MTSPVLCTILGILLLCLMLNIRGPADILQQIEWEGNQFPQAGRAFGSVGVGEDASSETYLEGLKAAYSPDGRMRANPHDFRLILDEPMACMDGDTGRPRPVLLLVLVASVQASSERRQAIRETWGSATGPGGMAVVTLFLLARSGDPFLEARVKAESASHHDLLMEDFQDAYKNLTLKTLMAMKWAGTHCPHAAYVMKTDDDMFVSYRNLLSYLAASRLPSTDLALGLVIAGESPIRDTGSKWFMPEDLYPDPVYPPWLSGGGFVLSGDVPGRIYAVSLDLRYLHLEDVFVGLCLRRLSISPVMNRRFSNLYIPYSYCRYRNVITAHAVRPSQLRLIWKELLAQRPCWPWT